MTNDEREPLLEENLGEDSLEGEEVSESDSDTRLREKLGSDERSRLSEQQELVAQIIADPDVRAVLKAKESGESVKVVTGSTDNSSIHSSPSDPPISVEEEVDVEDLGKSVYHSFNLSLIQNLERSLVFEFEVPFVNEKLFWKRKKYI